MFKANGELRISGNSRPEDGKNFYKAAFDWIEDFKEFGPTKITLTLDLDYINSVSVRILLTMLQTLKQIVEDKKAFKVIWKYDNNDLDMLDQGKILEKSLQHTFEFIEKPV
ncbi:MAG: DUF1987 family protein [Sphingobacteriaceae bacterium]|nr:DUF1987 family protein [Sphingobacteriaceae bacterium]